MQTPSDVRRLLAFGVFEANIATRQLFRRGEVVHLQDHPFRVLTMLLERPGELITREERLAFRSANDVVGPLDNLAVFHEEQTRRNAIGSRTCVAWTVAETLGENVVPFVQDDRA